jgi:hypothetical protein
MVKQLSNEIGYIQVGVVIDSSNYQITQKESRK